MTTTSQNTTTSVDWDAIAKRLGAIKAQMIHHEDTGLYGAAFEAEALRRTFGYVAAGETRPGYPGRALPYDHLWQGFGLTTEGQRDHEVTGATALSRMQSEQDQQKVIEMRAEVARVYREARTDVANYLRSRCNERTVPSRYRREGVTWAADMIDPAVPKDQYGNLVEGGGRR